MNFLVDIKLLSLLLLGLKINWHFQIFPVSRRKPADWIIFQWHWPLTHVLLLTTFCSESNNAQVKKWIAKRRKAVYCYRRSEWSCWDFAAHAVNQVAAFWKDIFICELWASDTSLQEETPYSPALTACRPFLYIILYIRTVEIDKLIAIIQPQTGERARRRKFIFPAEGAGCCHNTPLILKRERDPVSLCASELIMTIWSTL